MSEATQDLIGKVLGTRGERDAIHIAVYPAVAARSLQPGANVGLNEDGEADNLSDKDIGVVDPFLKATVRRGERFFIFLYPNTATGLRHVYTHPVLDSADKDKTESEQWLRAFADRLFIYDPEYGTRFDVLIENAEQGGFGTDIEYGYDCQPTAEFWDHFERYTGRKVVHRPAHFRCAC